MSPTSLCCQNTLFLLSLLFLVLALLTYTVVPTQIENKILEQLVLGPNTTSFEQWRKPSVPIYHRFYLFNLTNIEQVFAGGDKPHLAQLGPYTFAYSSEKVNITWDQRQDQEGKVSYGQIKRWHFVSSLSNGSLDDVIHHFNVPLLSALHYIDTSLPEEDRFFQLQTINSIIEQLKLKMYTANTIRSLLFEGYEDTFLKVSKGFHPKHVKHTWFGWMYGQNNTLDENVFRIYTGHSSQMGKRLGLLDAWNNVTHNTKWPNGTQCQSFEHVSGGELQPPFYMLNKQRMLSYSISNAHEASQMLNTSVHMFNAELCRAMDLRYSKMVRVKNLDAYRYVADNKMMDYSIPENRCYCLKDSCPPNGLYHVGACRQNAPIYISYPHYLYADTQLLKQVDGLRPDESQHQFFMDFDKQLAMPLNVRVNLQINLFIKKLDEIDMMEEWPESLNEIYLPQFWSSVSTTVDDETATMLTYVLNYLPLIIMAAVSLFAFIFVFLFGYLAFDFLSNRMFFSMSGMVRYESVCVLENETNGNTSDDINMKDIVIV